MNFISKKVRVLLLALTLITGTVIASGYFHYRELNRAEDPRVIGARMKMMEYNKLMGENESGLALLVLDQVEEIYRSTPGYENSYELGVILNNRGPVFLVKVETDLIKEEDLDTDNLMQAKQYIKSSIDIYTSWLDTISTMDRDDIHNMILPFFPKNDPAFTNLDLNKIIEKRVDDIMVSKIETERRLSVSYTNLGIINRYERDFEEAIRQYEEALELWHDNHAATNNLNQMLGLPPEKRNILKEMFFKNKAKDP